MIILSTLLNAIASILDMAITLYIWIVIAYSLMSWVRPEQSNPIVQFLTRLVEPVLSYIRRFVPTIIGGVDLSPIIVILFLQFVNLFLVKLLFMYSSSLS